MKKEQVPFYAADILIPKENHEKWAVVACDQFTSQPEYWNDLAKEVEGASSALNVILPEAFLGDRAEERTLKINETMRGYLSDDIFDEYKDAMIYVERTLPDGKIRYGIVGAVDLEQYDYNKGSRSLIRATEGTVLDRIPPRVKIRENAPIELPHVMLLVDDITNAVIGGIDKERAVKLYDFDLTQGGGHLTGYLVNKAEQERIKESIALLAEGENPLLFAVGDGNHSLATAKECYSRSGEEAARYALVEVVNIHDKALEFEPIYRVVFGCDENELISAFEKRFTSGKKKIEYISKNKSGCGYTDGFTVYEIQSFLDEFVKAHEGVTVDYIHGEEVVKSLSSQPGAVGFIFDGIEKSELFPYIAENGVLPRKTFSMGEAASKRYYMEAHKIK